MSAGREDDLQHLEDPEAQEGEKLVALIVEAVIFAGLQNAEQQEGGKTSSPGHDEDGADDLASMVTVLAEGEGDDGEEDEIGAAGEVGQLVELERVGYGKEKELVGDGDEQSNGEIVVIQDVDGGSHGGVLFVRFRAREGGLYAGPSMQRHDAVEETKEEVRFWLGIGIAVRADRRHGPRPFTCSMEGTPE